MVVVVVVVVVVGGWVAVLLGRNAGVRLGAGHAPARGRLERHPAVAVEPHLRPGVGVATEHEVAAVVLQLALREADGDAGGDPERAGHRRKRAGELLAVADPVLEERLDRRVAVAVGDVGRVGELGAEPVLQRDHLVELGRLAGRHLAGRAGDDGGKVVGELEKDGIRGRVGGGGPQLLGGEARHRREDGVDVAVVELRRRLDERLGQRVEAEPGPLGPHGLGGGRHEGAFEVEDRDELLVGDGPGSRSVGRLVDLVEDRRRAATTARRRTRAGRRPASTTGGRRRR